MWLVAFLTDDLVEKEVSVMLDGDESSLIFVDHGYGELSVRDRN